MGQRISVCLWFDDQAEEAANFYVSVFKNAKIGAMARYDEDGARQDDIDWFWTKLSTGGQEVQCGWLKDRFGVSWQVVPTVLPEMLRDKDSERARRVMAAMLRMKKIDIAALKNAYAGRSGPAA